MSSAANAPVAIDPSRIGHKGMITVSIMLATIMQALDTTIANVALPHMQGTLQASADQITWVLTSYIVAAAIATPLTGWLCTQWGRKHVFLISVTGFTIASALCGMADSMWQIVAARLLQGIFGAALVPLSQAVLLDINPPAKAGQAMAVWGAGIMIGPILGPMLGGWLTEAYDWRWVFYINLPVGVLAFYGIARYLPETRSADSPLDLFGFATLSLAIGLLQLFLDRGEQLDWFNSNEIRIEAIGALIAFVFFVAHTWTVRGNSFFDRALLRDRNFVVGTAFAFIVGLILYATMALLPNLLQGLLGYTVVYTGEVTAPRGIGTMLAMMAVGKLMHVIDVRTIMAVGFAAIALALYQMTAITLDMDSTLIIVSGFIQGIGIGLVFVPLSAVTFSTLAPQLRNNGTPIFSLLRNIGSSVGISIVQALLTEGTARAHAGLSEAITPASQAVQDLPAMVSPSSPSGLAALNSLIDRQAAMISYLGDFKLMMWLTILSLPLVFLLRRPAHGSPGGPAAADAAH
ncbi:MAG: DHA2 family efflux MFS transporter permease subunit [Steroidobacteraceae bacterium]